MAQILNKPIIRKVQVAGNCNATAITIPHNFCKKLNITGGDYVVFTLNNDNFTVRKLETPGLIDYQDKKNNEVME